MVQKPVSPYGNTASPGKRDLRRSRYDAVLLFIKIAHDPIDVNPFCHGFAAEARLPAAGISAALPSGSRQIFKIALLNFLQNPV